MHPPGPKNQNPGAPRAGDSLQASAVAATFRPIPLLINRLKTLRTQTLVLSLALLLGLGGLTVILGAWVTHRLKQHLVREAQQYAREEVAKSSREIQDLMRQKGLQSVQAAAEIPEIRQRIRLMLNRSDGTMAMAAILGPDGATVWEYRSDQVASITEATEGQTLQGNFDNGRTNYTMSVERIDLPAPTPRAGTPLPDIPTPPDQPAGYLAFQMSKDLAGSARVQRMSAAVSESLAWMVLLLLAILALAMALVYKIFNRHLALEKEKDAQGKMAAIGTLASGLAHEIRNPLQVIDMNLEVIREDLEDLSTESTPEDRNRTAKILGGVQSQIGHLNHILHDFMQFAIPGRMEKEQISLATLLGDTLEFMGPELARVGVEARLDAPESARIVGDPSALRRVFLNILINAIRAMENAEVRRLTIHAEPTRSAEWGKSGDWGRSTEWQIVFEDTGCGIPEGKEEEIFEALVSFRPGGTGFGLAIARRIIEDHGGHIRADKRKPGQGALIRIALPALNPDAPAPARQRNPAPASQSL